MKGKYLLVFSSLLTSLLFIPMHYQDAYGLIVFGQKVDYDVDTTPTSVAAADFNNDKKLDLAITNGGAGTVSILLGDDNGTFQSATNVTAGEEPEEVVASDFNADEKVDLAIANSFDDTISILLGNGDGTFEDALPYDVGEFPFSITVADFNGDTKNDLAVANSGLFSSGTISLLLGNGEGTFQNAVTYTAGSEPTDIYSSDFNADNNIDLAVTNSADHTLSILLGKGDGTFQPAVNYAVGQNPFGVTGGDFNNDQKEDVAVANTSTNTVSLLLGNGEGTFQTAVNYGAGKWPIAVAASDFDHDGTLDLAVANSGDNTLSILQGAGGGVFQLAATSLAGEYPYDLIASDVNGDGFDDLGVVNNNDNDPSDAQERYAVSVLLNNSSSTCPLSFLLKDSTSALAMIRNFRDTRLARNTQGKRYTDLYYRHASEITIMLIRDKDLLHQTATLMNQLLPTINFLQQGRIASLSQTMAGKIQSLLNSIAGQASPGLCSSIHELKDDIKNDGFLPSTIAAGSP